MSKKGNNDKDLNKELSFALTKNIADTLSAYFDLPKRLQIGVLTSAGCNYHQVAEAVDTTYEYVRKTVAEMNTQPKFRERIIQSCSELPAWFRMNRQATLPMIAEIMNEGLK